MGFQLPPSVFITSLSLQKHFVLGIISFFNAGFHPDGVPPLRATACSRPQGGGITKKRKQPGSRLFSGRDAWGDAYKKLPVASF